MIPKIIHYCWFGRGEKPALAKKCIASWHEFFPDYEIKEWNEDNYDVRKIKYTEQAYSAKKYAFVSDYARFDILYKYGGIYFDTDVEVIRPFDDILVNGAFMGCERDGSTEEDEIAANPGLGIAAAPGLGIAAAPGLGIYKEILDYYKTQPFLNDDGTPNLTTVVIRVTEILMRHGLKNCCGIQTIEGITIYPSDYFNPMDSTTGRLHKSANTHSIHWYGKSWLPRSTQFRCKITNACRRVFGKKCFDWMKRR